jgi:hypothetical protein
MAGKWVRYWWGSGYVQRAAGSALKASTMTATACSMSDGVMDVTVDVMVVSIQLLPWL